jgi:hypothetical protein
MAEVAGAALVTMAMVGMEALEEEEEEEQAPSSEFVLRVSIMAGTAEMGASEAEAVPVFAARRKVTQARVARLEVMRQRQPVVEGERWGARSLMTAALSKS